MRALVFVFLISIASGTHAVGWEEVLSHEMRSRGIATHSIYQKFRNCTSFKIEMPTTLHFGELGEREFYSARYVLVEDGKVTFPLRGTAVDVKALDKEEHFEVNGICVSPSDMDRAYLAANYLGPQGSPPMVVYFRLEVQK